MEVKTVEYRFELDIRTDGDFGFQFMPRDMEFDGSEDYSLKKDYTDREHAFNDVLNICQYLHDNVTGRDWNVEDFKRHMKTFMDHIEMIRNAPGEFIVAESMSGNYDGTEFVFSGQSKFVNCGFRVTDEEWDIIKQGIDAGVNNEMIKSTMLKLCQKQIAKNARKSTS